MTQSQVKAPRFNSVKMRRYKAEVTVFLSLLMGVMLIFIAALVESATVQIAKSYARGEADRAMESIFAEYHQELLEEFGIFAIESTYETGNNDVENVIDRLALYGSDSMEWDVVQMQLLSDDNGAAFEAQIVTYMQQKYGLDKLEGLVDDSGTWTTQQTEGEETTDEMEDSSASLLEQVELEDGTLEMDGTALEGMFAIQGSSALDLVVGDSIALSTQSVEINDLPSHRTLENGVGNYQVEDTSEGMAKIMVCEYALEFYESAVSSGTSLEQGDVDSTITGLQYELEYILEGKDSDQENLSGVVNQLLAMRMAPNYVCLLQSVTMRAEVSTLALSIATASGLPELEPIIEQALLLGWAYGESIMDIRSLLKGNKVTLLKSELDWQLDLDSLMTMGTEQDNLIGKDMESGLDYEEYLRILIYLEDKDTVLMRALDMLELRLNATYGLTYFKVDQCITQLEFINTSTVIGGYTYEFPVFFSYR